MNAGQRAPDSLPSTCPFPLPTLPPLPFPWRVCVAVWLAWAACSAGEVTAELSPLFGGHCRLGWPVAVRVVLSNPGDAADGTLDVAVEGVRFRQPVRLGARTQTAVEAVVTAQSAESRARVTVRDRSGAILCDTTLDLGLQGRDAGSVLAAAVGTPAETAARLFGEGCTAVAAEALPASAAGFLAVDALVVGGHGSAVAAGSRSALVDWVRGGGLAVFVLEGSGPVPDESLLCELGRCAGRATPDGWLSAVAERAGSRRLKGGVVWRLGLGTVVAGRSEALADGALAGLARGGARDPWVSGRVYEAFGGPRWSSRVRWRLVGGAVALLAAGLALARVLPRRRVAAAAVAVCGSAVLAAVAWLVVVPGGRCVLEVAGVAERRAGEAWERRTELAHVAATGRGRVRLSFGEAEAAVPIYQGSEEVGSWRDAVVERDAAGRLWVECELTQGMRRCFAAWWPAREESADPAARGEQVRVCDGRFAPDGEGEPAWRPLRDLDAWGKPAQRIVEWQARRARKGVTYAVQWHEGGQAHTTGESLLERRIRGTAIWSEQAGGKKEEVDPRPPEPSIPR